MPRGAQHAAPADRRRQPFVRLDTAAGGVEMPLAELLTPVVRERARDEANQWIKRLRLVDVGGRSLRDALHFRGESMWWFVELYLHRQARITALHEAVLALDELVARQPVTAVTVVSDDAVWRAAAHAVAVGRGIEDRTSTGAVAPRWRARTRLEIRSLGYVLAAVLSRLRLSRRMPGAAADIAVFVHSAFVRPAGTDDRLAAQYLGDIVGRLRSTTDAGRVGLIGLGPRRNFGARRWWDALVSVRKGAVSEVIPIERYAPLSSLLPSLRFWWQRHAHVRTLTCPSIRRAAMVAGCDVWPVVEEQLLGAALLQLPWSARACDEAGAALDRLRPRVAVTYAEAGGWGRALILEARRRGIPTVGLQHGFIYRHWLNYLHEPDEIAPSPARPEDRGYPAPDRTLVFDGYAKRHLLDEARFPGDSVIIVGSPTFETLRDQVQGVDAEGRAAARRRLGAGPDQPIAVVVSKHAQIAPALQPLVDAARALEARLVIVPHPGESAGAYHVAGAPDVTVADAGLPLATLLAAADGLVTVNSTVAVDAMALGLPSLVVLLPNNLSPFVDAGAMLGAATTAEIGPALQRLLLDEACRTALGAAARGLVDRYGFGASQDSSSRAARAILDARTPRRGEAQTCPEGREESELPD